jgi:hypothetical protein
MTNLLYNGGFDGNLYRWSGSGVIDRVNGYPRAGCASLAAGQSIESEVIGLSENWMHTIHFFYQLATGATLTVSFGSISQTFTGSPLSVWREGVLSFALDASEQDSVTFAASGGAVLVDTATLLQGALPIRRAMIAAAVAARMTTIVTDAALSSTASATGPEGDYSAAVDEALRALGAVNAWGDPDVTQLDPAKVNDVIDAAQNALLVRLRATYSLETDVSLGPRRESRSQIATNIGNMLGGGGSGKGGGQRVTTGKLTNADWRH